ncbi:hypothetical protein TNCV_1841001 [Trichonephila clavipes]|nr:hypothetical protein TNCV_1841001 [Trichonephila clavipes]
MQACQLASVVAVVVANATCLMWSERGPQNSSWQGTRNTSVVGLGMEHHPGDSTNKLVEIPRRDDRWRHHLSPPPQFWQGTEGEGNILQSLAP